MYDLHDDAGHHHESQYKQITAFKRQDLSLAWALLGTLGTSATFWLTLTLVLGNFTLWTLDKIYSKQRITSWTNV